MKIERRALMTLSTAKAHRKALIEKLANKAVMAAGMAMDTNSQEHWADVGKYRVLNAILMEADR